MKILVFLLLIVSCVELFAKLELPTIFGDNAVLQRSGATVVRGKANPGQTVSVELSLPLRQRVRADKQGNWIAKFDLRKVPAKKAFSLSVSAGDEKIQSSNLIVGDVWFCSGQSNMEKPIGHQPGQMPCLDWEKTVKESEDSLLRVFTVARSRSPVPLEMTSGKWILAHPQSTAKFTAVGYYFARAIRREMDVPIGIVHSSWGGSKVQEWLSPETLAAAPEIDARSPKNKSMLYNGMVHPLKGMTFAGFLWYQGEANCMQSKDMDIYSELLRMLISSWRDEHGGGEIPFYGCQLAFHAAGLPWSGIQIAQSEVFGVLPNTGLAVLTDVGEYHDIHPRDKATVGERLAKIAMNQYYGKDVPYAGPVVTDLKLEGATATLTFETGAKKLKAAPVAKVIILNSKKSIPYVRLTPESELEGFEVVDAQGQWVRANAKIKGKNQIRVSAKGVNPVRGVRYMVGDKALGNLYNDADLPASPFLREVGKKK